MSIIRGRVILHIVCGALVRYDIGTMSRRILTLLMIFVLVGTSQSIASAKGAAPASGKIALCVGAVAAVVYVDAQGKPTAAPQYCPDGTLATEGDAAPAMSPVADLVLFDVLARLEGRVARFITRWQSPLSRGPPVFV